MEMNETFSFQPTLYGENISLRPLAASDFDGLFACASNKKVWAGHPNSDRYKEPVFREYFESLMNSRAAVVVTDNITAEIIGTSRYYLVDSIPDDISIGFTFLSCDYWGGKTNFELKKMMLDYAFGFFDVVWFHVSPSNIRSQKATLKIGAIFSHEEINKLSGKNDLWFCYKIGKAEWMEICRPSY